MNSRNSGYVGVLFATFLALIWMIWSGLTVMLPDNTDQGCACKNLFHVIGHRGLSSKAPENTLSAFRLAAESTGYFELDIMMTVDDQLALMHDDYVDRTTDGHGQACRMTLAELQNLDAGQWFSEKYGGEHVPTLDETFKLIGNQSRYLINIKKRVNCGSLPVMVKKISQEIAKFGLQKKVAFSIEDKEAIQLVKSILPESTVLATINVLYTLAPLSSMWSFVEESGADGVNAHFLMPLLKNTMMKEANMRRKRVFIYTVDSMYVSKWLECLGVDAIISNSPQKILTVSKCPVTGAYDRRHQYDSQEKSRRSWYFDFGSWYL